MIWESNSRSYYNGPVPDVKKFEMKSSDISKEKELIYNAQQLENSKNQRVIEESKKTEKNKETVTSFCTFFYRIFFVQWIIESETNWYN